MRRLPTLAVAAATLLVSTAAGAQQVPGAATGKADPPVKVAQVEVEGAQKAVLVDEDGRVLYYYTPDSPTRIACTGRCAEAWPPLTVTGEVSEKAEKLPGTFSVLRGPNGPQLLYQGHPLYAFSGDAPGQAKGQGLQGRWFVATPDLKASEPVD